VALLAGLGETSGDVIGVGCPLKIFQVARDARRGRQVVIVIDVAVSAKARGHGVRSVEGKAGRGMIEFRVEPAVGAVALFACDGELSRHMIGIDGALEVRGMAGITIRGHGLELAVGSAFVAGIAIDGGVRSSQRKAVIMLLHLLDGDVPSAHGVALLAVGAELAFVNIGVAILAALPHIGENHLHVTLGAGHRLVHAAQGIAGVIVIELGDGANGTPRGGGVAILARDVQIAVRTAGAHGGVQPRTSYRCANCEQQYRGENARATSHPRDSSLSKSLTAEGLFRQLVGKKNEDGVTRA